MTTRTTGKPRKAPPQVTVPTRQRDVHYVAQWRGVGVSTLHQHIAKGLFPAPIKSAGTARWTDQMLDDWLAEKLAERDRVIAAKRAKKTNAGVESALSAMLV